MKNDVNRQWLLNGRPEETNPVVIEDHFKYAESPRPEIGPGQFLVRSLYLSIDPAMQGWMRQLADYMPAMGMGDVMLGRAVGRVVESNNSDYPVGDLVYGVFGWQDYYVSNGVDRNGVPVNKPPKGAAPQSVLGALGTTGLTAYFGLFDIGRPVPGDTVLVSGAAGAVGSLVGQLAKLAGCRVIGTAGGPKKCDWVVKTLGFDACVDYKTENVLDRIAALAPAGVNVFFDNVGGAVMEAGLANLAMNARVALCGGIAGYTKIIPGPANYMQLVMKRARMEGFLVVDYMPRWPEGVVRMSQWIAEGKLKETVDIAEGFDMAPKALIGLFSGANMGKQIVKIGDDLQN
ncbi:NADP-dependent oxidoreductase [Emcibacter sp. SYSU 3D8]|uniref:NADP-dependent oxidoreductase n=1 Tax=Emcibacter sp. SYSU 3D8 TaxID=3133969 RepID=UPI0031FE9264